MATTAIWDVTDRLKRVLDYTRNPDKTAQDRSEPDSLQQALGYATAGEKTEKQLYVSGINCDPLTAYEQMQRTKRQFQKTEGILAFHGYQSFAPGEATPEIAHAIGVKLAQELWGDRFEVVVATHLDKEHVHNHFVLNSVSFADGKRYYDNKASYALLRQTSDRLCQEHALSVIQHPEPGKVQHYGEWKAERENKPTWRGLIRDDVDQAVAAAMTMTRFFAVLQKQGYEVKTAVKYVAVRPPGKSRFIRLRSLGDDYTEEAIKQRILRNRIPKSPIVVPKPRRRRAVTKGAFRADRKLSGLHALYIRYLFQMGALPLRWRGVKRPTFRLREDMRKLAVLTAQTKLLSTYRMSTEEQLLAFLSEAEQQMQSLYGQRKALYIRIRRCKDEAQIGQYRVQISACSKRLAVLRKEVKLGAGILERSGDMKTALHRSATNHRKEASIHEHGDRGGQPGRQHELAEHRSDGQNFRRRR
ncbi:relaxase/mobilization nuclease domain-containing protein [Paenibacillus glucanolyticus]|uniref:relaxase/mobilization nuclease domain-containing protein n=1 Tax=Paenibacillus glucanolyticus TaxID=59843 RepID=UPI00128B2CF2|nr:relaxase/mobilization nuclease domain-containing protein [Paenibacillus glucanolyticus]MPY19888.1 relaxase/mobilization nuclease domain-containing protein [Paenibacillus glucanolyticus]